MNGNESRNRGRAVNDELIEVLASISVVSMRLARKMLLMAAQGKSEKGEKQNEQRYVNDLGRTAQCRRSY